MPESRKFRESNHMSNEEQNQELKADKLKDVNAGFDAKVGG